MQNSQDVCSNVYMIHFNSKFNQCKSDEAPLHSLQSPQVPALICPFASYCPSILLLSRLPTSSEQSIGLTQQLYRHQTRTDSEVSFSHCIWSIGVYVPCVGNTGMKALQSPAISPASDPLGLWTSRSTSFLQLRGPWSQTWQFKLGD